MVITWDIEASDLLNDNTIDYTASPYVLKDCFSLHCIVVEIHETGEIIAFYDGDTYVFDGREYHETDDKYKYHLVAYESLEYTHFQLSEFTQWLKDNPQDKVIAHNGINYDHLVAKLALDMDYTIGPDSWNGVAIDIEDTMVMSKTLNPDRFGGHSLDALGKKVGLEKIEFRKHMKDKNKVHKFMTFAADMLYYCIRDVRVNTKVYHYLKEEWSTWGWDEAYQLEKAIAEIVTRQSHRGFSFDSKLAKSNVLELDKLIVAAKTKIEPILPPKNITKTAGKVVTPPEKQFNQNGELNANIRKFVEKHGGVIHSEGTRVTLFDKEWELPLPYEPLIKQVPMTLKDTTHIKEWIVDLGWVPSEWGERDLSVNSKKKKLDDDQYEIVVDKYIEQTLNSNFRAYRLDKLKVQLMDNLKLSLMKKNRKYPVKVYTNPKFTKGQEKEICPNLLALEGKFPYAKDIVEYLTYNHRRNSILGGGMTFEPDEEPDKGYLSYVRADGRISTPADTCGAATSRMKHREVANIPRVTSLYGEKMRALFGTGPAFFQLGYDFDSLEAREEAHYCFRYDNEDKAYCKSLTLPKPNDVHSVLARKISDIIEKEFNRTPAKSVKYAATYGATAPKIAQTIGSDIHTGEIVFDAFWQAAFPLAELKGALTHYWKEVGGKKFILGLDGRKVPTRSAHAILNSLFQSAGVICAKRAAVLHDRLLKAADLLVDFFKDDWRNKEFFQQMIMYHDEVQGEVSKGLVKFKRFETEEGAEAFKQDSDEVWSDIGKHKLGGYFIAYCEAGELAAKAVAQTSKYYKLNVPLTAGYILGNNWAQCH